MVFAAGGALAGTVYGYGLMTAALAAMLGAGGVSFFLLVATSPLLIGFASGPVVGSALAWRERRWVRIAVACWLGLHLGWVVLTVSLEPDALPALVKLARVLPVETGGALLFWLAGQASAWWLVARGGRSASTVGRDRTGRAVVTAPSSAPEGGQGPGGSIG